MKLETLSILIAAVIALTLGLPGAAQDEEPAAEEAPAEEAPAEEAPAEEAPAEEAPAEEAPAEEAPAEEAPAEEAPAEEAPAEEAPAEEAAAETVTEEVVETVTEEVVETTTEEVAETVEVEVEVEQAVPEDDGLPEGWQEAEGAVVIDDYAQASKRGKKGAPNTLNVSFTFRNTTEHKLHGFQSEITWSGYGGVKLLVKPYFCSDIIEPGATIVVDGVYPETSSASSVYKILAPMRSSEYSVSMQAVQVMYREPTIVEEEEPKYPPVEEVITAAVLDQKLARNGSLVSCFYMAIQAGTALPAVFHVGFTVKPDGTTINGHIVEEELQGSDVEACAAPVLDEMVFGPFAGDEPRNLKYPFRTQ